jgi:competence protein ComEC
VEALPADQNGGRRVVLERARFGDDPILPRAVRIRLRATDPAEIATGDTLRARALLQRPPSPAYPGGWDLQRDAFFNGLGALGYALNPVEVVARAAPGGWAGRVQRSREFVAARIAAALPGAVGAIAATFLTGSTLAIPPEDRAAFRDSGLAHLLAIAGLHIGIVMGLVFGAMRGGLVRIEWLALHWPLKAIAAVAALAAGGAYMVITGAHVPIIRSFAMACLVTLGVLAGRRVVSLRGLGLAMAVLVLVAPQEVIGVSFQMSFSAVLALIVGYDLLRPWLRALHGDGWRRIAGHVVALALTSALAGTFSAPYGAYHFGHVQLYYVLANMVAVPITAALVMPAGLIALALMPLNLEFLALVPMGWGIEAILWIGRAVSAMPDATVAVPHLAPWGLALFSLGLAWLGLWRTRLRLAGLVAMVLGLASPAFERPPDILVSADARLIAWHSQGMTLMQRSSGGSAFTRDAWLSLWAVPTAQDLDCPTPNCLLQPGPGRPAAVLVRGDADDSLCGAALLVSAEPIRLRCSSHVPWIDRFSVWRNGAHAAWLEPSGVRVVSDRVTRGERPWVLGLPLAGRIPDGTRPALTED